jgi:hypothetical protein
MSDMIKNDKWERADKAFNKGIEAYIEFGQELVALNAEGTTQEEIGQRYQMSRTNVAYAICVGSDQRIVGNTNNLPKSQHSLYLLTTLDDAGFEKLAKPDTTQADIKAYKQAQQPPKPKAIPAPKAEPAEEPKQENDMKKNSYSFREEIASVWPGYVNLSNDDSRAMKEALLAINPDILLPENIELLKTESRRYAIQFSKKFKEQEEQRAKEMRDALPAKEQSKFERAVLAQVDVIVADLRRQLEDALKEDRAKVQAELDEAYTLKQAAKAEHEAAIEYRCGIDSHMTMEEFQLVRNCLHPDRAPEGKRDRYTRAFDIFNRLEKTVNTKAPLSILRRHGWEKASPFYKPH